MIRDSAGNDVTQLPIMLFPDARNTAKTFVYETTTGNLPNLRLVVGRVAPGVYNFRFDVNQATRSEVDGCPLAGLQTIIRLDDKQNPPINVVMTRDWICFGKRNEYLTTP